MVILRPAKRDLLDSYWFYERQRPGLGDYFLEHLQRDIDSLEHYAGIHRRAHKQYHWMGSKRFPHAVLYFVQGDTAYVNAVNRLSPLSRMDQATPRAVTNAIPFLTPAA